MGEIKKPTQEQRILAEFEKRPGEWISGQYFLRTMFISQFHSRIFSLQEKGYNIEAGETDNYGFKFYRLKAKETLF